ncbi:hypothetical protein [Streptomyces clavifer]
MSDVFEEMERRRPAELVMLYELEPEVRDVIVEGNGDKAFIDWFLSEADDNGKLIRVYPVSDRVYIPDSEVIESGYMAGERGRVIRLAEILQDIAPRCDSALLIADADYASIGLDKKPRLPGLLFTDYASMESYVLSELVIEKLLRVVLSAPGEITARTLIQEIRQGLVASFIIGACLRESKSGKAISPKAPDKIPLAVPCPTETVREIFRISLQDEYRHYSLDALVDRYNELQKMVSDDVRHFARGHDIGSFIVKYLKVRCKKVFTREEGKRRGLQLPELLELVLMSCLEHSKLGQERLFQNIERWLSLGREAIDLDPRTITTCA